MGQFFYPAYPPDDQEELKERIMRSRKEAPCQGTLEELIAQMQRRIDTAERDATESLSKE